MEFRISQVFKIGITAPLVDRNAFHEVVQPILGQQVVDQIRRFPASGASSPGRVRHVFMPAAWSEVSVELA